MKIILLKFQKDLLADTLSLTLFFYPPINGKVYSITIAYVVNSLSYLATCYIAASQHSLQ